ALVAELAAVVGEHAFEPPARTLQFDCDAPREPRCLGAGWIAARAGDELASGKRGGDVDCGQLPHRPLRPSEATNVEAVHPHQLARTIRLHMPLGLRLARRLVGRRVASDERGALGARAQAVASQATPDAVVRDDDPTPARLAKLGGHATR